jgi:hypothetical protein
MVRADESRDARTYASLANLRRPQLKAHCLAALPSGPIHGQRVRYLRQVVDRIQIPGQTQHVVSAPRRLGTWERI